ncbi:hypothetical protein BDN70DRAFT_882551 [Pholiota conissans]|uniref:Uncharacterized protein n=1 Tax=Pholiota conissans TaxID=109636 RepID=A0A9P5YV89_9AGAR|nr:hypothetical protein BDN70DRAFT_882551 [Pholiota conissans]
MAWRDEIHDPPVLNPKGRPCTQRLTGHLEGRARGGGARIQLQRSSAGKKCGICRQASQP